MRQLASTGLVVMCVLGGYSAAHATETSASLMRKDLQETRVKSLQANTNTPASQPVHHSPGTDGMNAGPECDGQVVPSTGSVTALLSRVVRSSTAASTVQCPIPPVPDKSP